MPVFVILTEFGSVAAFHIDGRVASLVAGVVVVEQQAVRTQLLLGLPAVTVVVQVALHRVRVITVLVRTLELLSVDCTCETKTPFW